MVIDFVSFNSELSLQCTVNDPRPSNVSAQVSFSTSNVDFKDLTDLAGVRLFGITAESLAKKVDVTETSLLDRVLRTLEASLDAGVTVVTLRNYLDPSPVPNTNQIPDWSPGELFGTDIYFYAVSNKDTRYVQRVE